VALRSHLYTDVDGAVRCLEVFHRQELFFHANNHLLYPVDVFAWHRLLSLFGVRATSPFEYLALTQVMNAAAAAGCAAVLYRLALLATGSPAAALGGAALWAFSRAFLRHATNSAEPMVGLLWSCLALLLLALPWRRRGLWAALAAGGLLALGLATYQSTILVAPLAAVLCWAGPEGSADPVREPEDRRGIARLLATAAGGLGGILLVYGLAYQAMGVAGVRGKIELFLVVTGAGVFGGLSLRNLALLPLGLADNLVHVLPDDFAGLRSLLRSHGGLAAPGAAAVSLALTGLTLAGLVRLRRAWRELAARDRFAFACGVTGLAATLLGPVVWDPLYDKLWLQPLGCWSFLAVLGVSRLPAAARRPAWVRGGAFALLALAALNLGWAIPAHRGTTPYLAAARRVAETAAERDLVVLDWDQVSVLYGTVWGWSPRRHRLDFPSAALALRGGVRGELDRQVEAAWQRGGKVYFVGVLDQPRASWDVLLGDRAGVSYDVLAPYRDGARVVASFPYRNTAVHLFLWEGPAPGSAEHPAGEPAPGLGGGQVGGAAAPGRRAAERHRLADLDLGAAGVPGEERAHRRDEVEGHDPLRRRLAGNGDGDLVRVEQAAPHPFGKQAPRGLLHPHRRELEFRPRYVPLQQIEVEARGPEGGDAGVQPPRQAQAGVAQQVPGADRVGVLAVAHEQRARRRFAPVIQTGKGPQEEDVAVAVGQLVAGEEHGVDQLQGHDVASPKGAQGGVAGQEVSGALVGLGTADDLRVPQRTGEALPVRCGERAVVVKAQRHLLRRIAEEAPETEDGHLHLAVADDARHA
jgi:hypothetical protein